ncbi:hypothetical protein [Paenibacillus sp. LjRoot56]|uniref:hypothetical protein n=1 Tax=Paenibacillus sp. LjRoot56 TaxID=3342333 RepID=UPI003ED0FC3B
MTWQWMMVAITLIVMTAVVIITFDGNDKEALKKKLEEERDKNSNLRSDIYREKQKNLKYNEDN